MGKEILVKNIYVYDNKSPIPKLHTVLISASGQLSLDVPTDLKIDHVIDAAGRYSLMPGLLDSHVHGQGGYDFADVGGNPLQVAHITKSLGSTGLSYVMATFVSLDLAILKNALKTINDYILEQEFKPTMGAAKIVGVHLEGPFISKKCKGAHAEAVLQKEINIEIFTQIISAAPAVTEWKITLAPDLPGAIQFIKDVKQLEKDGISVKVFLGHSNPENLALIGEAIHAGVAGFTHLGNACQETCCRETHSLDKKNATSHLVQWVLENPELCPAGVELLADGTHLSSSFVSLIRDTIGDKIVLVTDALGPTGLSGRSYMLGSLHIIREKQCFYLADANDQHVPKKSADGLTIESPMTLAGSASSMADCIKWFADQSDKTSRQHMHSIYMATIWNARNSTLSKAAIDSLPDQDNFCILDDEGQLLLSNCNRQLQIHHESFLMDSSQELSPTKFAFRFFKKDTGAASAVSTFDFNLI